MTIKESVVEVGAINMGGLGGAFFPVFLKGKMRIQHSKGPYSSKHVPIFDGGKYSIVVGALHAKKNWPHFHVGCYLSPASEGLQIKPATYFANARYMKGIVCA